MADYSTTTLRRVRERLLRVAQHQLPGRLRGKVDPSDVVQASLLEACDAEAAQPSESGVIAFMRKILQRNLIDLQRHFGRDKRDIERERSLASPSQAEVGVPARGSSPSQHVLRLERGEQVEAALARLPEAQREVLQLRFWRGMGIGEIGLQLDKTPAAVAGLLRRGTSALRDELERRA